VVAANAVVRGKSGIGKNVYFCSGEKGFWIRAVTQFHVYFCLLARKGRPNKIKELKEKMSTFVHVCIPFTFGGQGFGVKAMA
jgi:hypothetical protein